MNAPFYGKHPDDYFHITTKNINKINKAYMRFNHKDSPMSIFAQADTGSEVNVITTAYLYYLGLEHLETENSYVTLDTFGHDPMETTKSIKLDLTIEHSNVTMPITFLIQQQPYIANATLGQNFLRKFNIDLNFSFANGGIHHATSLIHNGPYYGLTTSLYSNSYNIIDIYKEAIISNDLSQELMETKPDNNI